MSKPKVIKKHTAENYSEPNERIIGFNDGGPTKRGGLISLINGGNDTLNVHIYQVDPGVQITVGRTNPYTAALSTVTEIMQNVRMMNDHEPTKDEYLAALAVHFRPTVEIVTIRDPDEPNDYTVFIDGTQNSSDPGTVTIHDIDLGAAQINRDWLDNQLSTTDKLSPNAAAYVRKNVTETAKYHHVDTSDITNNT